MMMLSRILVLIGLAALAVMVVGFTMLNKGSIELSYYYGIWELPKALVVAASVCVGIAVGFIVCFFKVLQLKRQIAIMRRTEAREKKKAVSSQLRTVSLEGSGI